MRRVEWEQFTTFAGMRQSQITMDDLDNGYDNPSPSADNPGTTYPTQPTLAATGIYVGVVLEWDRQTDLTNFSHYEVRVSATAGAPWSSLGWGGTGLGTEGEVTVWPTEFLVHAPLPLDGDADDPQDSDWTYSVRRVTKTGAASPWSTFETGSAKAVQDGTLGADSVYANNIRAGAVTAVKMNAENFFFTKAVGSENQASPSSGDVRSYLGKDPAGAQADADPVGISIEEYNGENYETKFKAAMRSGGGVADAFVSGFFEAGESVLSSPGLIWTEASNSHTVLTLGVHVIDSGTGIMVGNRGELSRSTNYGKTWSSLITSGWGSTLFDPIQAVAYIGTSWVVAGAGSEYIARSTDDGASFSLVGSLPFTKDIYALCAHGSTIISGGTDGQIGISSDEGGTWSLVGTSPFSNRIRAFASNGSRVFAGALNGEVAYSDDSGSTWSSLVDVGFGTTGILDVYGHGQLWIVVGGSGKLSRSTDNGATWSLGSPGFGTSEIHGIVGEPGGPIIIAGYDGKISRSTDSGQTWGNRNYTDAPVSQPYGVAASFLDIEYVQEKKRFVAVGQLDSGDPGVIYSDWLEAGSGIVEKGTDSVGDYIKFSTGDKVYPAGTVQDPSTSMQRLIQRVSQSYADITGYVRICAMGPNEFAYRDNNGRELGYVRRPYRGGTWALVGTAGSINTNAPAIAALSRYEIATYDPTIDRVRTYRFSGSTWSHISGEDGTAYASTDWPDMCSMNSNRVALALDGTNSGVVCFDRSSGTWTKVGNAKSESWGRRPAITALTESRVVVADSTNDTVRIYDFDDTDFTQIATVSESGMANGVGLAAIDATHFVMTADGTDEIILYEFDGSSTITELASVSVTNSGWCDLAVLGPDEILYARGNESPGYLECYDVEYYVDSSPPNPGMAGNRGAV